jgi:DNA-binding response OmpR family regulator
VEVLRKHGYADFADFVTNGEGSGATQRRLRVCAVDDSRVVLSIYRSTLHELGFEPVLFEFPASALEWLRDEKPAVVLTDLNMPKMSGLELASKIREFYGADELPIILVTTQSDARADTAVEHAGINEVLGKPFDAQTLLAAVNRHLLVSCV